MLRLHDDSSHLARHDGVPALLGSGPLLELLDQTAADIARLEELAPGNPVIGAYRRHYERLWSAVDEAATRRVWLSTEETAERMGVSQSHVQHLCARDDDERPFHARKVGGVWRIDAQSLARREDAA